MNVEQTVRRRHRDGGVLQFDQSIVVKCQCRAAAACAFFNYVATLLLLLKSNCLAGIAFISMQSFSYI